MRRDDFVDFFFVADGYSETHRRMEEWSRWVRVRQYGTPTAPMFKHYRPEGWEARDARRNPRATINTLDALDAERALECLPTKHKAAIRWVYLWSAVPSIEARMNGWAHSIGEIRRDLGVTKQGLGQLIIEGRSMLRNHGVGATD